MKYYELDEEEKEILKAYNSGKLKSLEVIQEAADQILTKHKLSKELIDITVGEKKETYRVKIGRGRPNEKTKYIEQ